MAQLRSEELITLEKEGEGVIKKVVKILLISLLLCSCNRDNCSSRLGFDLDYHLFAKVSIEGISYCDLVNKSLDGSEEAIIKLSKVQVYDGASYQHGAVLIEVIDRVSEQRYLSLIKQNMGEIGLQKIYYAALIGGLDFTINKKYKGKTIDKAFPILTKYISDAGLSIK
jgi:hypothetical protein